MSCVVGCGRSLVMRESLLAFRRLVVHSLGDWLFVPPAVTGCDFDSRVSDSFFGVGELSFARLIPSDEQGSLRGYNDASAGGSRAKQVPVFWF